MYLTVNKKEKICVGISFILEFYKIVMGTFLTLFVPQKCGENVCTLNDNIYNTQIIHLSANFMNFITFFVVFYFYFIELKREYWYIEHLDIDVRKPNNNLDTELELYPKIKNEMFYLDYKYLYATRGAILSLILNFIISTISIGYNFYGITSLNSIFSFLLLISVKVSKAYSISQKSIYNKQKYSAYTSQPKTYNTVSKHYKLLKCIQDRFQDIPTLYQDNVEILDRDISNNIISELSQPFLIHYNYV